MIFLPSVVPTSHGEHEVPLRASNLVQRGDRVFVLNSGYLLIGADNFHTRLRWLTAILSLQTYGVSVKQLKAPIGGTVPLADIETVLKSESFKVLTFTHVDTSGAFIL